MNQRICDFSSFTLLFIEELINTYDKCDALQIEILKL